MPDINGGVDFRAGHKPAMMAFALSRTHERHSQILERADRSKPVGACADLGGQDMQRQGRNVSYTWFGSTDGHRSRFGEDESAHNVERTKSLENAVNHEEHFVRRLVATRKIRRAVGAGSEVHPRSSDGNV